MRTLIIGSTALKAYDPKCRKPKDLDAFTDDPNFVGDKFWHPALADWLPDGTDRFATLDELYTIKVSHSYWVLKNGSWDKHMLDVVRLQNLGGELDWQLHALLYSIWKEVHGNKRVNLQMSKADFFADAVVRKYDHDSIHYSVAYEDAPIYEDCFVDGQDIEMDMAKIKALPWDRLVKLYREEIYATALERWIIPSDYKFSPRRAYAMALQKTIVSLTKGWSATFLVDNYQTFRTPDIDYVAHHLSKKDQLILL